MRDSEELPDDVPAADAADQQRPVSDEGRTRTSEPPTEPPLEAAGRLAGTAR